MKVILFFILSLLTMTATAGTCSSISRTNFSSNQILTSTALNTQFNDVYGAANDLDGGCITDGTIEASALNSSEFAAANNGIYQGCKISKSDSNTISVDRCIMTIGGNQIKTTSATTVTWGCGSCSSESASTTFYVYALTTSDGATMNLLISTSAPNGDGFDGSGNKVIGRFYNDSSQDIAGLLFQWESYDFKAIQGQSDYVAHTAAGSTLIDTNGEVQFSTVNIASSDFVIFKLDQDVANTRTKFTNESGVTVRVNVSFNGVAINSNGNELGVFIDGTLISQGSGTNASTSNKTVSAAFELEADEFITVGVNGGTFVSGATSVFLNMTAEPK